MAGIVASCRCGGPRSTQTPRAPSFHRPAESATPLDCFPLGGCSTSVRASLSTRFGRHRETTGRGARPAAVRPRSGVCWAEAGRPHRRPTGGRSSRGESPARCPTSSGRRSGRPLSERSRPGLPNFRQNGRSGWNRRRRARRGPECAAIPLAPRRIELPALRWTRATEREASEARKPANHRAGWLETSVDPSVRLGGEPSGPLSPLSSLLSPLSSTSLLSLAVARARRR